MRYKPKNIAALQLALGGLPDRMRVEVDSDIEISQRPSANFAQGDGVTRKFGHYGPAASHLAEAVARVRY